MTPLIVGCGSIGRRHLRNLLSLGVDELIACDVRADRADQVSREYGVPAFVDLQRALEQGPDVVFVCTPTSLHLQVALAAAERSLHLFIEKPLSHTLDGVDALLRIASRNKLVALVGCNFRFHPGLQKVKQLLDDQAIGSVISVRAEFGQYLPDWRPGTDYRESYSARQALGGGIILDQVHELDYLRWLLGEVREVFCFAQKRSQLEMDAEDSASMLLRFACGAAGVVQLDCVRRDYRRACEIIGEEGILQWDLTAREVRWYSDANKTWTHLHDPPGWTLNDMYVDELRHFLRCVRGEETPAQDLHDAHKVLAVAMAAKNSAQTGALVSIEVDA